MSLHSFLTEEWILEETPVVDTIGIIGITTVIFGVASLLLISKARSRLTHGSIRRYMDNFAICLAFIVIFSVWQTVRSILDIKNINIEGFITYPEYVFLIFAYVAFIVASYRVLRISEEFGFKEQGKKIEELARERQNSISDQRLQESESLARTRQLKKKPRSSRK